jgi:4-amino-4-deoxy-L-arabinose transferase-like glycosyltransferase
VRARARRLPRLAWILLAVAFALRTGVVLATIDTPLVLDPADWSGHGWHIASGQGMPDSNRAPAGGPSAFRPPGYPVFLGAVYWAVGVEADPVARLVQALLGTVVVGLIGLIALRLWGKRVALIALGLAAIAPPLVVLSTALVSEGVFVPLVVGAVAAALEARRSSHPRRWALLVGFLVGLAWLTRTNGAVLLLPLGLALWTTKPRLRPSSLVAPALVVLAAVLTVTPWTIRNYSKFHALVPVSTQVGYTLAGTYNHASRDDKGWPAVWKEAEHGASPEYAGLVFNASVERWSEKRFGDELEAAAWRDIEQDPGYVLTAAKWNTLRLLHLRHLNFSVLNLRDTSIPEVPAIVAIAGFYPLLLLALIGLFTKRVRRAPPWLWLVPLTLTSIVVVTSFIRFRAPIDPFLVLLAAAGFASLTERRWRRPGTARAADPFGEGVQGEAREVTPREREEQVTCAS